MAITRRNKCALCLIPLALFLILFGIFFGGAILDEVQKGIDNNARLRTPSEDSEAYSDWADTSRPDVQQTIWSFYFYNYTNVPDIIESSAVPVVNEIGPYSFRELIQRFNVTFSDNDERVSYTERTWYKFRPDLSAPNTDPDSDKIIGPWATWTTVLAQAGSEQNFLLGASQGVLSKVFEILGTVFCVGASPTGTCDRTAWNYWANVPKFAQFGLTGNQSFSQNQQIMQLIKAVNPDAYALLAGLAQQNLYPEFGAYTYNHPSSHGTKLTTDQALSLLNGTGTTSAPCPLLQSRTLPGFPGPVACTLVLMSLPPKSATAQQLFPQVSDNQREDLYSYFHDTMAGVLNTLAAGSGVYDLRSKLFLSQTANEWAWKTVDPLAAFLNTDPSNPQPENTAYFPQNYTSIANAWKLWPYADQMLTGKNDASQARQHTIYKDMHVLPSRNGNIHNPGVFCGSSVTVSGHDLAQFQMGSHSTTEFKDANIGSPFIWVSDVRRPVPLEKLGDDTFRDIDVERYTIADGFYAVDHKYDQYLPGLANLSCPYGGTPAFLSSPHGLKTQYPNEWKVKGMRDADFEKDGSFLYIDPVTGATLSGYERLQINLLTQVGNTTKLLPALWVQKHAEMTDKQRKDYDKILDALKLQKGIYLGGVITGSIILTASIVFLIYGCYKRRDEDELRRQLINESVI